MQQQQQKDFTVFEDEGQHVANDDFPIGAHVDNTGLLDVGLSAPLPCGLCSAQPMRSSGKAVAAAERVAASQAPQVGAVQRPKFSRKAKALVLIVAVGGAGAVWWTMQ